MKCQNLLFSCYDKLPRHGTLVLILSRGLGWQVDQNGGPVTIFQPNDLVVCFGYRHICSIPDESTLKPSAICIFHARSVSEGTFRRGAANADPSSQASDDNTESKGRYSGRDESLRRCWPERLRHDGARRFYKWRPAIACLDAAAIQRIGCKTTLMPATGSLSPSRCARHCLFTDEILLAVVREFSESGCLALGGLGIAACRQDGSATCAI